MKNKAQWLKTGKQFFEKSVSERGILLTCICKSREVLRKYVLMESFFGKSFGENFYLNIFKYIIWIIPML